MPMSDNSGAAGRPLSACQSEEAPTAPPIRPGIAVGSSPSGTLYASRPPRCAPLCPRRRPALVASRLRDHAHRADRAARPIRIAPTARRPRPHPSRCGGNGALAGKNRAVCIPFSPNARKRPPPWQYLREMHAFRDQDGKILALCIHFRVQSGDSGYMARESCHQGPLFASRARKSCMARRCCQRCSAFRGGGSRAAGPRTGRTGLVPCGRVWLACRMRGPLPPRLCQPRPTPAPRARELAERALCPAARAWSACHLRPPSASRTAANERNRAANSMRA